jgi:hypothetical protein
MVEVLSPLGVVLVDVVVVVVVVVAAGDSMAWVMWFFGFSVNVFVF